MAYCHWEPFSSCCAELASIQVYIVHIYSILPSMPSQILRAQKNPEHTVAIISLCSYCPCFFYLTSLYTLPYCLFDPDDMSIPHKPTTPDLGSCEQNLLYLRPVPTLRPVLSSLSSCYQLRFPQQSKVYFDWPWVSSLAWYYQSHLTRNVKKNVILSLHQ